jgi:23S rRNA (guanosine2251-2'-O)-methyltransferase
VLEFLKAGKPAERVLISRDLDPSSIIGEIRKRAEGAAIPVRLVPKAQIDKSAGGTNHQGVVAITGPFQYTPLDDLLARPTPAVLFLDGLTDPHNLGSLLRSADGAGFDGVVVPAHRSVGVTAAVRRVSAGAAEVVPVARVTNLGRAVDEGREAGLWMVGMDAKAETDIYSSTALEPPVGLVLGSEDRGISANLRKRCDDLVRIPSRGRLASLNVAVAGAVAMFEIARRRTPGE